MWYSKVVADLSNIPDFITHYEHELDEAKRDCRVGGLVEKNITALPGLTEHRFNQLQEVEAVLPEIVATREDGTKVVKYEKLVALLIEAVKEQQQQINQISQALQNLAVK
jgi:hypothetical protein